MFERMGMRLSHEISKSNRFVCQISNNSAYLLYKNLFDFILYTFTAHQGALLVVISIFGLGCGHQENANYTKLRLSKSLFLYMFHWRQIVFSYYMYFHLKYYNFAFLLCKANACSCCCCLSFWHRDIIICIFIVCHDL